MDATKEQIETRGATQNSQQGHAALGPEAKLLFSLNEASFVLRTCRTSLKKGIALGLIKSVRVGRSRRIHRDELERLAREGLSLAGGDA